MASVIRKRTIQYSDKDGRRRTLSLGRIGLSQRQFDGVLLHIDRLVAAQVSRQAVDPETARWLGEIGAPLVAKLAEAGLVERREAATLGPFLDSFVASRGDVKDATRTVYGHTKRCLIEYFGADKPLKDITEGDADDWRLWLVTNEKLADNTCRRRCGLARQFFRTAVRKRIIASNPFEGLASSVRANPKRFRYISKGDAAKVLDACPDAEWRLIFALSRYGGLRCPSEHLALKWSDVDWGNGWMTVHSPKTEHHPGGESRKVPLFPELEPYLQDAWDLAQVGGSEYVIVRARDPKVNLRKNMTTIIRKAGLEPWPKLFQNLRSTRETELIAEGYPEHQVLKWIGNSKAVAAKFYLQVTDEDYRRAAGRTDPAKALHGALQHTSADDCEQTRTPAEDPDCEPLQTVAAPCSESTYESMGDTGLEQYTPADRDKIHTDQQLQQSEANGNSVGAASGAADNSHPIASDPDLALLVRVWPVLPESVKGSIMAIIRGAGR